MAGRKTMGLPTNVWLERKNRIQVRVMTLKPKNKKTFRMRESPAVLNAVEGSGKKD